MHVCKGNKIQSHRKMRKPAAVALKEAEAQGSYASPITMSDGRRRRFFFCSRLVVFRPTVGLLFVQTLDKCKVRIGRIGRQSTISRLNTVWLGREEAVDRLDEQDVRGKCFASQR